MREKSLSQCSEQELVDAGASAASSHWVLGEAASLWCKKYSSGRTASDFAELTGWTYEAVTRAITVFERMAPLREKFPLLNWSHFRAASSWTDAERWLSLASKKTLTKDAMRAARAQSLAPTEPEPVAESEACDSESSDITAPPLRELTQGQLDEVDNTDLLKQLRKSLAKFRTKFGRRGWAEMADALAVFEHGLREAIEGT